MGRRSPRNRTLFEYEFKVITFKDSRAITENDQKKIIESIEACPANASIVITHGTYTMPDTARFIQEHLKTLDGKRIVLTGSMIPLKGFSETDASFNLGFAIASAFLGEPGIYVAMNGRLFTADHVHKNLREGKFEEI